MLLIGFLASRRRSAMTVTASKVLVIGATSAIAEATARVLAARGAALYLVGRNAARLQAAAADLAIRGAASVGWDVLDLNELERHETMLARAEAALGGLDAALIAHGTLSDQRACEESVELTMREMSTNALSVIALATRIGAVFGRKRSGTLVVISSVAGDRGRSSNYVYGSAKAAVTTFMSGLRQRLHGKGVCVITIKPGFVDTPMTAAFTKGPLWATPASVAAGIVRAMDRRRSVVYLPFFWRPVMLAVRMVPERLFRRLTL
jgi:decaprenylphospho-beta-D-erythro-pentofuranosid-2-ulose 2-reductase